MPGRFRRLKETLFEAVRVSLRRPKRSSEPSVSGSRLEDRTLLSGQRAQEPLLRETSPMIASGGNAVPEEAIHPGPSQAAPSVTAVQVKADARRVKTNQVAVVTGLYLKYFNRGPSPAEMGSALGTLQQREA